MTSTTTWIVCGGRVGRNLTKRRVFEVLDYLASDAKDAVSRVEIVHGSAAWVDTWAGQWAKARGHLESPVPIDDDLDGMHVHGPRNRNRRMLNKHPNAAFCLGFPGGGGTNDMMTLCHAAGMPVADVEIERDGTWEIKWWPQK